MQFPTKAEKALAAWQAATKTIPFEKVANQYGGWRDPDIRPDIEWVFDDESIIHISGRGKSYVIEARLP